MTKKTGEAILVVDDESQIRRLLKLALEGAGYQILLAETGQTGLHMASTHAPALILLDLGLPDMDGIAVLKRLREWSRIPIIILSVRDSKADVIAALDEGADDYVSKPFHTGELLARIRSAIRHAGGEEPKRSEFRFSDLEMDLASRLVRKGGELVRLTATEYALLVLLVRNAGKVLTHRYILEQVWGHAHEQETQYTRIYIAQLRKKIEKDPANPRFIVTESGIGYRFMMEE